METDQKRKTIILVGIFVCLIELSICSKQLLNKTIELNNRNELLLANNISSKKTQYLSETTNINDIFKNQISNDENIQKKTDENTNVSSKPEIVYDGLTLEELTAKLNKSLNSTIAGKGELFASYSLKLGLDPYLTVAIVLHETGCSWDCSELVKQCNNVGGQKGAPGCWGGSYQAFNSLDEGIIKYMDNLYSNYYAVGLTTPEAINTRYAESQVWASKINTYIEKIKAN